MSSPELAGTGLVQGIENRKRELHEATRFSPLEAHAFSQVDYAIAVPEKFGLGNVSRGENIPTGRSSQPDGSYRYDRRNRPCVPGYPSDTAAEDS